MKYFICFLVFLFIGCGSDTLLGQGKVETEHIVFTYHYDQCWDSLSREQELIIFKQLEQTMHIQIVKIVPFKCEIPALIACWHKYILTINTVDIVRYRRQTASITYAYGERIWPRFIDWTIKRINLFYVKYYPELKISVDILPK